MKKMTSKQQELLVQQANALLMEASVLSTEETIVAFYTETKWGKKVEVSVTFKLNENDWTGDGENPELKDQQATTGQQ
jgi:hypothetical protein